MITEYIRKILSPIPNWIITVVAAIVPTFFNDPSWALVFFIVAIACSLYIQHRIILSEPIDLKSDNSTKKQFEVFDLLSKWQKKRIKTYFYFSIGSLLCIPLWFSVMMYYHGKRIFEPFDTGDWYIILIFLTTLIIYSSYFVWSVYTYSINFYDSDIPQILWNYIEELIEQHGSKKGELKEQLGEDGNKQLLFVLGKLKDGKIPTNLSEDVLKEVLKAEIAIIEILKSQNAPDIKKNCEKIKSLLQKIESHITSICAWKRGAKSLLQWIKRLLVKNKTSWWGIIIFIFIVAFPFAYLLLKEPKPLVIFVGGGSVYNFLDSKGIKVDTIRNSVYSNMPSGNVGLLLREEIQRFGKGKEPKHPILSISLLNKKIVDRNIESLKPFLYIGLSAEEIKYDSLFNSEYAQVYEYKIGEDPLAVYYVKYKNNQQQDTNIDTLVNILLNTDTIDFDTLVENLLDTSKHRTIYTTSQNSGTLNAYAKYLGKREKDNDSINLMKILYSANKIFKDDTIQTNGFFLSSYFYPPKNNKESTIKRSIIKFKDTEACKKLYVYFVGYKSHDNIYKPNSQVIDFLNKLYDMKHPDEKKKDYFSKVYKWEIDPMERKSIKKIPPHK